MSSRTPEPEGEKTPESEPEVYAVSIERGARRFTRRDFIEITAASSAALVLTSCGPDEPSSPSSERKGSSSPGATGAPREPTRGRIPAGTTGKQLLVDGEEAWLPCHEPLPAAAVCTCDCVHVRRPKSGRVPSGRKGMQLKKDKKPAWLPCESPLPAGYVCTCDCVNVPRPKPGDVPPGTEGIELEIKGETYRLPCGSPIPADAVCTCNCITVPSCSCVGHTTCSCVGHSSGCAVVTHYWYPN